MIIEDSLTLCRFLHGWIESLESRFNQSIEEVTAYKADIMKIKELVEALTQYNNSFMVMRNQPRKDEVSNVRGVLAAVEGVNLAHKNLFSDVEGEGSSFSSGSGTELVKYVGEGGEDRIEVLPSQCEQINEEPKTRLASLEAKLRGLLLP